MTDQPVGVSAHSKLACGLSLFLPAITAHVIVVYNNVGFVFQYFGTVMLATYLAATIAALALPHAKAILGYSRHLRATGISTSLFIAWITVEENIHASKHWSTPEGASHILLAFGLPDAQAKGITIILMVAVSYAVVELLSHFSHTGYHLTHQAHCELRGQKQ